MPPWLPEPPSWGLPRDAPGVGGAPRRVMAVCPGTLLGSLGCPLSEFPVFLPSASGCSQDA